MVLKSDDAEFEQLISKLSLEAADLHNKAKYLKAHKKVIELADAHRRYGVVLAAKGDKRAALENFEKAAQMDKESPEAHLAAGDLMLEMGRSRGAIGHYEEALAIDNNSEETWAKLAAAHNGKAEHEKALSTVAEALNKTNKTWPEILHERVVALVQLDRPREAIDDVESILKDWPIETLDDEKCKLYAYVLGSIGDLHFDNDAFQQALGYYERSVELSPDAFYLGQLGLTLVKLGPSNDERAVDMLRRALEAQPENFRLWLELGNALFRLGRFEEALAAFEKVIGLDETMHDAELQLNNVTALLNVGRQAEAKEALERLTGDFPFDLRAHTMLGTVYLQEEEYQSAFDVLSHAVTLPGAEQDSTLFYNLGYAALNLNDVAEAEKAFKQSLKINPKNEQAKAAVKAFGPEKITLRKRISGVREHKETLQEMLDRIKASLTAQRPPWIKRKSMEAIKMGFVKAMGGALTEMAEREKNARTA